MKIQLLRHATCLITYKNRKILLDPMFSPAGTLTAIPAVPNRANNPLVDLPEEVNLKDLIASLDTVLVSHTHRDHFDSVAMDSLPKTISILGQPADSTIMKNAGFVNFQPLAENILWDDICIYRTPGQHGTGEIGRQMGPVSGFVLKTSGEPDFYITGDSIWCPEIQQILKDHQPGVILCFAGAAQFHEGLPITMTAADILQLAQNAPQAKIMVVHMEAWNHCRLSRSELKTIIRENHMDTPLHEFIRQIIVPDDGDELIFE